MTERKTEEWVISVDMSDPLEYDHAIIEKNPLVRCRDCEHYDTDWESEAHPGRHWCETFCQYMEPDGFCAWGERRDA